MSRVEAAYYSALYSLLLWLPGAAFQTAKPVFATIAVVGGVTSYRAMTRR